MLKRLGQVLVGTLGFVLAIPILLVPPPGDGNWLFFLAMFAKIGLGLALLLKSLDLYRRAAFPPDSPALSDPVAAWYCEQDEKLYRQTKLGWMAAQFLLLFMPVVVGFFLLAVLLRPFYATFRHPQPGLAVFAREGRQTLQFVIATLKGLFFLTLATLLGSSASLLTLVVMLSRGH